MTGVATVVLLASTCIASDSASWGSAGQGASADRLVVRAMDAAQAWLNDPVAGVFELAATILKGPDSAFRRKQIQLTQALDAGRLYLLNDGSLRVLGLAPFVRVLAGQIGQDACYFYNRLEGTGARWVSYHFHADHFHAEPELVLPDDDLVDLLTKLAPAPAMKHNAAQPGRAPEPALVSIPRADSSQPVADGQLYGYCQHCGYPFGHAGTPKFCAVRARLRPAVARAGPIRQ